MTADGCPMAAAIVGIAHPQPAARGESISRQLIGLWDTKLLYRELGNLCCVFNASLADIEYFLSHNRGERIVTVFKTRTSKGCS
jgi:hypothetical protein